jgi:hypothetical protein
LDDSFASEPKGLLVLMMVKLSKENSARPGGNADGKNASYTLGATPQAV